MLSIITRESGLCINTSPFLHYPRKQQHHHNRHSQTQHPVRKKSTSTLVNFHQNQAEFCSRRPSTLRDKLSSVEYFLGSFRLSTNQKLTNFRSLRYTPTKPVYNEAPSRSSCLSRRSICCYHKCLGRFIRPRQ